MTAIPPALSRSKPVRRPMELHFNEVPAWIEKLINTLTPFGFEDGLRRYERIKRSSNAITQAFCIERCHPWYESILQLREAKGNLKTFDSSRRLKFEQVAFYAIQIEVVLTQTKLPERIKKQMLSNLVDLDSAYPTMVEVLLAYHYWRHYAEVNWIDSDTTDSEFQVTFPEFQFVVECKHFGVDTGKHAKTHSFSRMTHYLKEVLDAEISGHICVELNDRLPEQDSDLYEIATEISRGVKSGFKEILLPKQRGRVTLAVQPASGIILPITDPVAYARSFGANAYHAIFSKSPNGDVSPLVFSCTSKRKSLIYSKLRKVLSNAKEQIGGNRLGLIFVHYDGLQQGAVEHLKKSETFSYFNNRFLSESPSIAAVCYGAGPFSRTQSHDAIYNEVLQFKNSAAPIPADFSFIDEGGLGDSGILTV